ncbi:MAG: hypothetical protein OHK0036_14850 [Bacteroidia bacterium]
MNKFSYKFFLRPVESGKHRLYVRIIYKRKKLEKSLGVEIENPENFNGLSVKAREPNALKANILIEQWKSKLSNIILENTLLVQEVDLKKIVQEKYNPREKFFDFYLKLIEEKQKLLKRGGWKKYLTEYNKMQEFNPNLKWTDINENFATDYFYWLINHKGNNENTTHRAIRLIKTILNEAVRKNYIKENSLKHFKTRWINGKMVFLTKSELQQLHNYVMNENDKKLKRVGLYFLFSCYTGLRYSDVYKLKWKEISDTYIKLVQQKTGNEVLIPLNQKAKDILTMQDKGEPEDKVFKCYSNQVTNRHLKVIAEKSGINKPITFHSARHTFATVSIELGIPIEVISKILGHSDIKVTQVYAKILDPVKFREMEKWNY